MNQSKYLKYLNKKHDYLENNCITLINEIYKTELNSNAFDELWGYLDMPDGKPQDGKAWMKRFSIQDIEYGASLVAKKVDLTELQEYDVILFKSKRLLPIHFGMYVGYNKFIHLEEGRFSKIDILNVNWRDMIASIWRQTGKNT
jgi:hypothetical protein